MSLGYIVYVIFTDLVIEISTDLVIAISTDLVNIANDLGIYCICNIHLFDEYCT